jgi:4-hydroxy-L-threonine phosphate dehydrogenase PdxA
MNFINVTQGHENSIGLEVFIKSFLTLDSEKQSKFKLFSYKDTLEKNLNLVRVNYNFSKNLVNIGNSKLKVTLLDSSLNSSESFTSLIEAEKNTRPGDVLLTLPTTKNSLQDSNNHYTGHTDYFRKKYSGHNPVMLFKSEDYNMALLTEHISLSHIEESITEELIKDKLKVLINNPYFNLNEFLFSGVNPHCGEDGLLGRVDSLLKGCVESLKKVFESTKFEGPISGDTIFLSNTNKNSCIICAHHDQGLAPFKSISGLQAVNITLGLPFLRLSPDHGTGFDLYGKDKANYLGALYTIKVALKNLGIK